MCMLLRKKTIINSTIKAKSKENNKKRKQKSGVYFA